MKNDCRQNNHGSKKKDFENKWNTRLVM